MGDPNETQRNLCLKYHMGFLSVKAFIMLPKFF